ncbi:unknown [Streptomyces phage mu1/6]|uniref:hypothetical protein n=1 Tax=Streptomyces phage mu1/6 TaxID=370623 RepID=UPI0000D4F6B1|nr:hypothetical protein SPMV1_gp03 [Streptomyces phage mu1/6]ABD94168.1 unknown [Streptomyces phage mu1/6]
MGHHGPAVHGLAIAGGRVHVARVDQLAVARALRADDAGLPVQLLASHPDLSDVASERPVLDDVADGDRLAPLTEIAHTTSVD